MFGLTHIWMLIFAIIPINMNFLAPITLIFGRVSLASRSRHAYISRPKMVYHLCVRRYKRIQAPAESDQIGSST